MRDDEDLLAKFLEADVLNFNSVNADKAAVINQSHQHGEEQALLRRRLEHHPHLKPNNM